jgi:hypothetical protein
VRIVDQNKQVQDSKDNQRHEETVCLDCWCETTEQMVVARNSYKKFCVVRCIECGTYHNFPRPVSNDQKARELYSQTNTLPERYNAQAERWAQRYL